MGEHMFLALITQIIVAFLLILVYVAFCDYENEKNEELRILRRDIREIEQLTNENSILLRAIRNYPCATIAQIKEDDQLQHYVENDEEITARYFETVRRKENVG